MVAVCCEAWGMTIVSEVHSRLDAVPGRVGFYARCLRTSESVEYNSDLVLPTESAAKVFVLLLFAHLAAGGIIDPDSRVPVSASDHSLGSGVLRYLEPGLRPTLDDLAVLMIIVSDNTATRLVLREVGGPDAVNAHMAQLGLGTARVNPAFTFGDLSGGEPFGSASPHDLAEAYSRLDDHCRRILFRQQFQDGLPRLLPHAAQSSDWGFEMPVRVFNKTGGGLGTYVDSGLFETDTTAWVVAAMASEQLDFASRPDDAAPRAFADIGELLHRHWNI
jgi:beta-lactamase class A